MAGNAPSIRCEIADYLNVGTKEAPEWELMGQGFTALDENPNAQLDTTAYISDKSSSSTVIGYQPQFPFTMERIVSQRAIMAIYKIGRNQLTGADAQLQYLRVETDEPADGQTDTYAARMFNVAVEVTDSTGEGAQKIISTGNLNQVGDFADGTFDRGTKIFSAIQ